MQIPPAAQVVIGVELLLVAACFLYMVAVIFGSRPLERRLSIISGVAAIGIQAIWTLMIMVGWQFGWVPKPYVTGSIVIGSSLMLVTATLLRRRIGAAAAAK